MSSSRIPQHPSDMLRRVSERLISYRPVLDRVVFALALLGLLTSAHLSIQQQRGFDQGCTGFSTSLFAGSSFDCGTVTSSGASTLLGVSNSVWGILFYVFVAVTTALAAFNVGGRRPAFKTARGLLISGGFLYSLYLVYYQFFVLEQLCALCLLSAAIVTLLFVSVLVEFNSSPSSDTGSTQRMKVKPSREIAYMGALVVLLGVLVGADVVYFNNAEMEDVFASETEQAAAPPPTTVPTASQPAALPAECQYDLEKGLVENFERLISPFDPTVGDPNADVTVLEYFDPNCPHCKTMHEIMMPVVQDLADRVQFVFKPFVLWRHSIPQSEALYAASEQGKFFEMLDAQYAIQNPQSGLSAEQLRSIAERIGMDEETMMRRIERRVYQPTLMEERQKGIDIGVSSTPTVLINGRFVDSNSKTEECLRIMIEEAAE